MRNCSTPGKIHVSGFKYGNLYLPRCVPVENEYVVPIHVTRFRIHVCADNYQQWYIQKSHGYHRLRPK